MLLKNQATVIMKFLKVAKKCYESSNYSSAFSIYDGLQDITVRNLPAWQHVSSKCAHIMEKISSFKVYLDVINWYLFYCILIGLVFKLLFQNEPLIVYNLSQSSNQPVIPSMHLFLLTIQQNEHGSFQFTNGLWKWNKLEYVYTLTFNIIAFKITKNFE